MQSDEGGMTPARIQRRLSECLADNAVLTEVPGAAAAIWIDDRLYEAATGVLSVDTRVPVTADSVFQIGSITKMLTATLVMQLVDQGLIDIDRPVVSYLPEFCVADAEATATVTPRQLLSHMSGVEGDLFLDTGDDDSALQRYVAAGQSLTQIHAPGRAVSYCNFGYSVLGRLIERMTGLSWAAALRERLVVPLGARRLLTRLDEVVKERVAVGHVVDPQTRKVGVVSKTYLPVSLAPAGSTVVAALADLMLFARMHLDGGRNASGQILLSPESVAAMQSIEGLLPSPQWALQARGLGWVLSSWSGQPVYGHDGGTTGQASFLRVLPHRRMAMILFANALTRPKELFHSVFSEFFRDLGGVEMAKPPPAIDMDRVDAAKLAGRYRSLSTTIEVFQRDGRLFLRSFDTASPGDAAKGDQTTELEPVSPRGFRMLTPGLSSPDGVVFHDEDERGIPRLMLVRVRNFAREA
ncbi:serine hydrolase domain-containing protein [Caulobacter sp. CCUG 60055]|uniref:serine hydrolase domain-containing protein n=1 Tax=Caulobacter sp. CCUG 60055 TaxID=2100090 RepID=UPI001FA80BA0